MDQSRYPCLRDHLNLVRVLWTQVVRFVNIPRLCAKPFLRLLRTGLRTRVLNEKALFLIESIYRTPYTPSF